MKRVGVESGKVDDWSWFAWVFVLALWTLPFLASVNDLRPEPLAPRALLGLLCLILFPTLLGYFLNTFALARVAASTTAVFIYFQPLVAGGSGVLLLGERPGPRALLAAGLLFAGIWLVAVRARHRRAEDG